MFFASVTGVAGDMFLVESVLRIQILLLFNMSTCTVPVIHNELWKNTQHGFVKHLSVLESDHAHG